MTSSALIRWSGPAAMLGGVLWIAGSVMVALMPEGCIGSQCYLPGRSMRDSSPAAPVSLAAVLLTRAGLSAVVSRAGNARRFGTLGRIGLVASVARWRFWATGVA